MARHAPDVTLVGRHCELEVLDGAIADAAKGRGRVVVLSGHPGIGKTRLAREASARAGDRGLRVAWGRAWEAGGAPAGWAFSEILRELATERSLAKIGDKRSFLHAIAPELAGDVEAHKSEDKSARFQTYHAVRALLDVIAAETPLLLVCDDMHAADAITLELLHFVARGIARSPVALLVTWRAHEARHAAAAPEVIARIAREATVLEIGPLARPDAEEMARRVLGGDADEGRLRAILETSEGNPLFVEELARGTTARPFGGIDHAIRGHLARLGASARRVAEIASVLGRTARRSALLRAARDLEGAHDAIEEAVRCEVLTDGGATLSFVHMLVRDAVYESLAIGRRRELHARALEALTEVGVPASELAHHALRALPAVSAERALELASRAADEARRAHAFAEAASVMSLAIEAAAADDRIERGTLVALELALARDESLAGRIAAGKLVAARVAELAERTNDAELLAQAALVHGLEFTSGRSDPVLISLLERALAALPDQPSALRARVLARYATALYPDPDPSRPVAVAHDAIEMARASGDRHALFDVLYMGRLPLVFEMPADEWLPYEEEALALARIYGDDFQLSRALVMTFMGRLVVGDVKGAHEALAEGTRISARFPEPQHRYRVLYANAMEENRLGRFDEAARYAREAEELAASGPVSTGIVVAPIYRLGLTIIRRDVEELRRIRDPLVEALLRYPNGALVMTAMRLLLGETDEVRAALQRMHGTLAGRPSVIAHHLALSALACGDRRLMEQCYERLLPHASEILVWGMVGFTGEGATESTLGKLAAALGRFDEARAHFERAFEIDERTQGKVALGHDHADWAELLLANDRAAEAPPHLEQALAIYTELGLAHLAERARESLATIESPAPREPEKKVTVTPAHVACEGDVFAITFEGATVRVRDGKGMRYLATLMSRPGRSVHVLDLVATEAGLAEGTLPASDAGPMIDERAREAYRQRLADLAEDLEEAQANADLGRTEVIEAQIDALVTELTRATGLGGRERRAGSAIERARVNVQRRIKSALTGIAAVSRPLAAHLERSVRTGTFCIYDPPAIG